jgi:hypothetical protein
MVNLANFDEEVIRSIQSEKQEESSKDDIKKLNLSLDDDIKKTNHFMHKFYCARLKHGLIVSFLI